jgi:flagellar basal body-associated protein FliL
MDDDQIFSEDDYYYAAIKRKKIIIITIASIVAALFIAFTVYCAVGVRENPLDRYNGTENYFWKYVDDLRNYIFG